MEPEDVIEADVVPEEASDEHAPDNEEHAPDGGNPPDAPAAQITTETAFVVYKDENGRWVAQSDLSKTISVIRESTLDDFYVGCASVQRDVMTMETANRVVILQQQMARQVAAQMETQRIAQDLQKGINPEKLLLRP
jgi:hypothetical protein